MSDLSLRHVSQRGYLHRLLKNWRMDIQQRTNLQQALGDQAWRFVRGDGDYRMSVLWFLAGFAFAIVTTVILVAGEGGGYQPRGKESPSPDSFPVALAGPHLPPSAGTGRIVP